MLEDTKLAMNSKTCLFLGTGAKGRETGGKIFKGVHPPFSSSNFIPYLDPTYGQCYQFNADNTTREGILKNDRGGTSYGLRAVVLFHVLVVRLD